MTNPMSVPVLNEPARGCGYRKQGGLYLVSGVLTTACDKLPHELTVCPCCQQGIKPARGWSWISYVDVMQPGFHVNQQHSDVCVLGKGPDEVATEDGRVGLIWVGEAYYKTPAHYANEAVQMGVSRRLHNLPRGFEVGKTLVLLAHRKAIFQAAPADGSAAPLRFNGNPTAKKDAMAADPSWVCEWVPGVFAAFIPERVEYVLRPEEVGDTELITKFRDRGITPVIVNKVKS